MLLIHSLTKNRVPTGIFGLNREAVLGRRNTLYKEEIIICIKVIESRKMA